jgi:aconitate hydratase
MGVLPLKLPDGWRPQDLKLAPGDTLEIRLRLAALTPRSAVTVSLRRAASGEVLTATATALLDTAREVALVQAGGIIPTILRQALAASQNTSNAA